MKLPELTVIMPVYNCAKYLSTAIDSVLNQTYHNFEFIIIDDASTDGSIDVVKSYNDERIILIENDINRGIVFGLNYAISIAKGKFLARMDGDDISMADRFEIQLKLMIENPGIGVCGSFVQCFGYKAHLWHPPVFDSDIKAGLINGSTFCHPAVMIKKEVLEKNCIQYCEEFYKAEDYYLWFSLLRYTQFYNIPRVLLKYRISDSQISFIHKLEQDDLKRRIQRKALQFSKTILDIELDVLFDFEGEVKDILNVLKKIEIENEKCQFYKRDSLKRALAYLFLENLSNRINIKLSDVIVSIFSHYSFYWKPRMSLGLIKRTIITKS